MQVNDIVIFSPRQGETAEGIVTRVWDKPASDPYVTIKTTEDTPRTFTRFASACLSANITASVQAAYDRFNAMHAGCIYGGTEGMPCTGTGA